MLLETRINDNYDCLTANDREIVSKIFREKIKVRRMNSTQISEYLHISRTTFVRFMKKLGISTYAEFKLLLEEEEKEQEEIFFDVKEIAAKYHNMIDELKKHDYSRICRMFQQAQTIYIYGSGNEQKALAEEFKRTFLIFGKYCVDLFDFGEVEFAKKRFRESDVFMAISLSGEDKKALEVMRCVQAAPIQTVSLTKWENNTMARMCQENLYVGTKTIRQKGSSSYEMVAAFYILLDILSVRYLEQERKADDADILRCLKRPEYIEMLLNQHYKEFNENERYICHFLTEHYQECVLETIGEFAHRCGVSQTMLVRFAKKIGLSGYRELKAALKVGLKEPEITTAGLMKQVTDSYHKMMDQLMKRDFLNLFEILLKAERIFIYGSGSSQARVASEMKRIFLPIKGMVHVHGHDMAKMLQKTASREDLVILISLSGESKTVVELAGCLQKNGIQTISVTRMKNNTLASLCTENLYIHSVHLLSGDGMEYETSTPYFILIEYLYLCYQNYSAEKKKEEK